jgi:hypothetical protein
VGLYAGEAGAAAKQINSLNRYNGVYAQPPLSLLSKRRRRIIASLAHRAISNHVGPGAPVRWVSGALAASIGALIET